ncbi:MAG: iron-containing alcohol dehydrogenase PsrA [Kiloniellales bacterium]
MWAYCNPVDISFGAGSLARVPALLGGRSYGLVTYGEPMFAELAGRLADLAGAPAITVDDIRPNPDFAGLGDSCARFAEAAEPPQVIVALGGGSVIDAAKVLAASNGDFARVRRYLETGEGARDLSALPIIAIPTTAGTGSEVTCSAALWDAKAGKKYSLALPGLYPEKAVVDPELHLGLPRALTISTGLDALSHALESLWNVNANPVSRALAVSAARDILDSLPKVVEDPGNIDLRTRVARAALMAGLAFSNTKTALAHALSYAITLRHGVPHGIACSFSLPLVMRAAIGVDGDCDRALQAIFGADLQAGADDLTGFLTGLGVSVKAADHGVTEEEWQDLVNLAFAGDRGRNFIGNRERFEASRDKLAAVAEARPLEATSVN